MFNLDTIFQRAKTQVESLYTDRVTVYENKPVTDLTDMTTSMKWVEVLKDIPCRLSYLGRASTTETEGEYYDNSSTYIKLFISPDISIKEGSRVEILRDGKLLQFKSSGSNMLYRTHREINLSWDKDN